MNILNPKTAHIYAEHVLTDNHPPYKESAKVTIECDSSWAGIGVFGKDGQLADVTVELYDGKLIARIWDKKDIGNDPTARVELCSLGDLTKNKKQE